MSTAARVLTVTLVVALAGIVGLGVWLMRAGSEGGAGGLPLADAERTLVADPEIALPEVVDVPATGTCPAFTFRAPVPTTTGPGADGYVTFALPGDDGSAVLVVCNGAVDEVGTPEEVVADLWSGETDVAGADADADVWERLFAERVTSSYGDAIALTSRFGSQLLTDHYVERDGGLHIVGYLRPEASGDRHRAVVDAMLASWQWR